MKPISISMQGFGVYRDRKDISFENIKDQNIFLISGSTGSGKTTILDAMCFALYCRATGGLRTWKNMRSISASDSDVTCVDYIFSLGGEEYRFKRSLKVHIVRGSGRRELRDEHSCYRMEDGEWVLIEAGSEDKIRKRAESIIGLDCEQFSRVIILPQGEFKKLILSSSEEKSKIFERLFMAERWSDITNKAIDLTKNAKGKLDKITYERDTLFSSFNVKSGEELDDKLEKIQEDISINNNELKKLENKQKEYRQIVEKIDMITKSNQKLDKLQVDYNLSLEKLNKSKFNLEIASNDRAKVSQMEKDNDSLSSKLGKLESFSNTSKEIKELQRNIKNMEAGLLKKEGENEELKNKKIKALDNIKKAEQFIDNALKDADMLPSLYSIRDKLDTYIKEYLKLEDTASITKERKSNYDKSLSRFKALYVEVESLRLNLSSIENEIEIGTISSLAMKLEDGVPCPVCGSKNHPKPAIENQDLNMDNIDKIKILKSQLKEKEKNLENLNFQKSKDLALCESANKEYIEGQRVCEEIGLSKEEILSKIKGNNQKISECERSSLLIDKARERLSQRERERDSIAKDLEDLNRSIGELNQAIKLNTQHKDKLEQYLLESGVSYGSIEKETNDIKGRIDKNKRDIEAINRRYNAAFGEHQKEKANLANANKLLEEERTNNKELKNSIDFGSYSQQGCKQGLESLEAQIKSANEKRGSLEHEKRYLQDTIKRVSSLQKKYESLNDEYSRFAKISELMNGKNVCKMPIKMFVLGLAFDDVLSCANIYLARLTSSRYSLSRVKDKVVGHGHNGLSLEVFDAHLGGVRPVNTLSGGELFLASLALAFGLSDAVQSYSGGIRLDSIFIDEGFGSLDQETLNTVVSSLNRIQQKGRMIGIISHVDELKRLIHNKLIVDNN